MGRVKMSVAVMVVGLMGLTGVSSPSSDAKEASTWQRQNEVRLRKMHLVRPDLIPYPTYQEFYA